MADIPFDERVRTLKVHPSLPDHRDFWITSAAPHLLPPLASLGVTVPIRDQGRQGSCTGHGFASMFEATRLIAGAAHIDRSRAFIYACERMLEHDLDQDAGASPLDGCRVLRHRGVCEEGDMPYNDAIFNVAPTKAQLTKASKATISGYARVLGAVGVKEMTAQRRAVGFGIAVYDSFERVGASGVVPIPVLGEAMLGGHWVFGNAGGYVDDPNYPGGGYFVAQNSWGPNWGKSGYCLIPYAYIDNRDYCFETRAIW